MSIPEAHNALFQRAFSILFQLTKSVGECCELEDILNMVSKVAMDIVPKANSASIMLLDEDRQNLFSKGASGLSDEEKQGIAFHVGEGIAGWVVKENKPALVNDVSQDGRFRSDEHQVLTIGALLSLPLCASREGVMGVLTVTSDKTDAFGDDDVQLLEFLGAHVAKDIENARLYSLSITDSLTQAYNRQYLRQKLPRETLKARTTHIPLSILWADIDHFKAFNDTYGHLAGDFVLRQAIQLAKSHLRNQDVVVRYGGEEFLFILPETKLEDAVQWAQDLRQTLERTPFIWQGQGLHVTLSFGAWEFEGEEDDELFLKRADDALRQAKRQGRNQVCTYDPSIPPS